MIGLPPPVSIVVVAVVNFSLPLGLDDKKHLDTKEKQGDGEGEGEGEREGEKLGLLLIGIKCTCFLLIR